MHQRLFRAKNMRVAHRPAHDPAQDIAAAFIGWHHTIGQQEACRPQMVCDHAMACLLLADRFCACELFRRVDERFEGVGVVIVRNALHHRCDAL